MAKVLAICACFAGEILLDKLGSRNSVDMNVSLSRKHTFYDLLFQTHISLSIAFLMHLAFGQFTSPC